jgi:hypothetical protein
MPFWSFASTSVVALPAELDVLAGWSPTMVDVDDERLKVLARGARCVSLSSADRQQRQQAGAPHALLVSFHDMVAGPAVGGVREGAVQDAGRTSQVETRDSGGSRQRRHTRDGRDSRLEEAALV